MVKLLICFLMNGMVVCFHGFGSPAAAVVAVGDSQNVFFACCRRPGLSKFFGGKSRSFSSLADVSSVSDLAKPNNPYAKRRRMGAGGGFSGASLDRHKTFYPPLSSVAGISKKPFTSKSSSSTLTIAVKLGGLTKQDRDSSSAADLPAFSSRTHGLTRTTPLRSFSLTDLPVVSNPSFSPFERSLAHQP